MLLLKSTFLNFNNILLLKNEQAKLYISIKL